MSETARQYFTVLEELAIELVAIDVRRRQVVLDIGADTPADLERGIELSLPIIADFNNAMSRLSLLLATRPAWR